MGGRGHGRVGGLPVRPCMAQSVVRPGAQLPRGSRLRGEVQMTVLAAIYMAAWASGFVLGYNVKMVRSAINAA